MRPLSRDEALARLAAEAEALPSQSRGCPMCALAAGHPPDLEILAARDAAVAVLDRYPARRGHVLIVLRRHVESIAALPWDDYLAVQRLAWEAARAVDAALRPRRVYVAALGSATPRPSSFPHHHVHVVPLPDGDERDRPAEVFTWAKGVEIYEEGEARALAEALRAAWPR